MRMNREIRAQEASQVRASGYKHFMQVLLHEKKKGEYNYRNAEVGQLK